VPDNTSQVDDTVDAGDALSDAPELGTKDKIEDVLELLGAKGSDAATAMIASSNKLYDRYQVSAGHDHCHNSLRSSVPFELV